MRFTPIEKLLNSVLRDKKYQRGMRQAHIEEKWDEIVGEQISKYSRVIGFERGRLLVECDHDVWRATLHQMKPELLARIEQVVGKGVVKEIFVK
ncbi:DUF721 domain-containing protein [bacterium]|nr:DUF721 domain-containing protein [bacterium]